MYEKFGQFIDGKWQKSQNNETYEVINPATEEILGHASKACREDVEKALLSSESGFKKWKNTCLLYTSPSPRDMRRSRMPSSA